MAKGNALTDALRQIEKDFGAKVETMETYAPPVPIPTGSLLLDYALGIGGLPSGRIVELFGPESAGKSTVLYSIAGACQRQGGNVVWIDAENVHNPYWAQKQGVDVDKLQVIPTVTDEKVLSMESILQIIEKVLLSGMVHMCIVDSVTALVPEKEYEQDIGDQNVSLQARVLSQALRRLVGVVSKTKSCLIFINQLRDTPGKLFGNPETTPGGRALKFYSSIRLDVRKLASLGKDAEGNPKGHRMSVRCAKNKVAPPFRKAEFDLYYDTGLDRVGELAEAALQCGLLVQAGSVYSYGDLQWKGADQVREALNADEELRTALHKEVVAKLFPTTET